MTLLSIQEAAALIKMSPETIRRWCATGHVAAYRHGEHGHYRVDRDSLLASLQRVTPEERNKFNLKQWGNQVIADFRAAEAQRKTVH